MLAWLRVGIRTRRTRATDVLIEQPQQVTSANGGATVETKVFVDSRYDVNTLRRAIQAALNVLGEPTPSCPTCCEGCEVERQMAIQDLKDALVGTYPRDLGDYTLDLPGDGKD